MIKFAQEKGVTLVVPGPEQPLVDGIADAMKKGAVKMDSIAERDDFIDAGNLGTRRIQPASFVSVPPPLQLALRAPRHFPRTS